MFLFGLPLLLTLITAALTVATYRALRSSPRRPAKLVILIALWIVLGAAWLYFRRAF